MVVRVIQIDIYSAVDREFEPRWYQSIDYKISICCFTDKHVAFRSKSIDRLSDAESG
jgi:hypothetical protein